MNRPPDTGNGFMDGQGKPKPSVSAHWISNALAVAVTAAIIGGIWWWTSDRLQFLTEQPRRSQQQVTAVLPDGSTNENQPAVPSRRPSAGTGNSHTHDEENDDNPTTNDNTDIDFTQTSWQNPFTPAHWESNGWTFHGDSMLSSGAEATAATFRRRYRKLSVECGVAPVGKPGAFEISLLAPDTNALMTARFTPEGVVVSAEIGDQQRVVKRRKTVLQFAADKPLGIRLTATGNRMLIVCNRRVVLSCNQPAKQSGKLLEISLRSSGGRFRITRLRLEGE